MLKIIMSFFKTDFMNKTKFYVFIVLFLGFIACKNEVKTTENNTVSSATPATTTATNAVTEIEHKEISRRQIEASGKLSVSAGFMIKYPTVKKGSIEMTESVKKWMSAFISEQIGFPSAVHPEVGFEPYVIMFRQAVKADKSIQSWEVNIEDNIIYNTAKVASIRIDSKTSFATSSKNQASALNSFDPQTGEILSLDKLAIDQAAMLAMCEKNVRTTKPNIFKNGFKFTKDSPFRLPKNFAITPQGVLFHYNPHEIAPNVLSDVEFTIPFEQLEKIMDLKKYI
jgi:Protein of unknown function (DUF3298)